MQAISGNLQLEDVGKAPIERVPDEIIWTIFEHLDGFSSPFEIELTCKMFARNAIACITEIHSCRRCPPSVLSRINNNIQLVIIDEYMSALLTKSPIVMPNVTFIEVRRRFTDLVNDSMLGLFPNVRRLCLGDTRNITDAGLAQCPKVVTLQISVTCQVTSAGITSLRNLKRFSVNGLLEHACVIDIDDVFNRVPGLEWG